MPATSESGLLDGNSTCSEGELSPDELLVSPPPAKRRNAGALALRLVALISVPLLWGSYTPALKLLLTRRNPPPPILTNLTSHAVGFVTLVVVSYIQNCMSLTGPRCRRLRLLPADEQLDWSRATRASLELGIYLFFGQLTQLLGLAATSATTNAILVQASVVVVPLIDPPEGGAPKGRRHAAARWLVRLTPSLLALGGVAMICGIGRDQPAGRHDEPENTAVGIGFSLASAAFYAMHTLRLSHYGDVDPTLQALGQIGVNTALDVLALPLAACVPGHAAGVWLRGAHHGARRRLAYAAAWNGVVVVGGTTWAMSYAQQAFSASTAALAYAMEPLFASVLAASILHDTLGLDQLLGGALILGANILSAVGLWVVLRRCGLVASR